MKYLVKFTAIFMFLISYLCIKIALKGGIFLMYCFGIIFSLLGFFLFKKYKNLRQRRGEEILKLDTRKPILYLRSFEDDSIASKSENDSILAKFLSFGVPQNLNSEEEQIALALRKFGPFIAIGDPRESIPQLGASKIYSENSKWKDVVADLIEKSQLIILRVGETPGLWWEVKMVIDRKKPEQIVFLLPSNFKRYNAFREKLKNEFSINISNDYQPFQIRGQSFSAILILNPDLTSVTIYCKERGSWLFSNGVSDEFKDIIQSIIERSDVNRFNTFVESRSEFKRTFLGSIQRIGGILMLGLIFAALLSGIVESCSDIGKIEAGSPIMLLMWLSCSIIFYLLVIMGEKSNDE